jgi:ribulose 1,5-bisphosphate synthetase/thiazole synthase
VAQVPLNRPLWLENAGPAFPALENDVECDAVVVGGGITGLTAAYALK